MTRDDLIDRIRAYYRVPGNETGGSLHIVLDDGNVDLDSVLWAQNTAMETGDSEGAILAGLLCLLPESEREELALVDFYPRLSL